MKTILLSTLLLFAVNCFSQIPSYQYLLGTWDKDTSLGLPIIAISFTDSSHFTANSPRWNFQGTFKLDTSYYTNPKLTLQGKYFDGSKEEGNDFITTLQFEIINKDTVITSRVFDHILYLDQYIRRRN